MGDTLEPGTHSIDRCKPSWNKDRSAYVLRWRIRLHDGSIKAKRTQARTRQIVMRKARAEAEAMLATNAASTYNARSNATDFLDDVVLEMIETADVRPRTKDQYKGSLKKIRNKAAGMQLGALSLPATMKRIINEVAAENGHEAARQVRSTLSAYVVQGLMDHGITTQNLLRGQRIISTKKPKAVAEAPTPTREEWRRVIDYVINSDMDAVFPGKTSGAAHKITARARHRRVAELTLLLATTGLRVNEARQLLWRDISEVDGDGYTWVTVRPEVSKTGRGRTVAVLDPKVAKSLQERRRAATAPVIGAPADIDDFWERAAVIKAVREYYPQLAELTGCEALRTQRAHVWRRTLNTMTAGVLPVDVRAAWFGHTVSENEQSYTTYTQVKVAADVLSDVLSADVSEG